MFTLAVLRPLPPEMNQATNDCVFVGLRAPVDGLAHGVLQDIGDGGPRFVRIKWRDW